MYFARQRAVPALRLGVIFLSVFFLSVFFLSACSDNSPLSDSTTPDDDAAAGRVELAGDEREAMLALAQEKSDALRAQTNQPDATISDVWILTGNHNYLVGKGTSATGECANIAIPLDLATSGDIAGRYALSKAPVTHSCEGAPCTSCSFTTDAQDKITGCDCESCPTGCNPSGGICNHTITSG